MEVQLSDPDVGPGVLLTDLPYQDGSSTIQFTATLDSMDVASFLGENGVPFKDCQVFEDNDIDGEAFLELTESEIKSLVPKLGIVKKILRLQKVVTGKGVVSQASDSGRESSSFSTPPPTMPPERAHSPTDNTTAEYYDRPIDVQTPVTTPYHSSTPSVCGSDDNSSVFSSVSASTTTKKFKIPDTWRPSIMECIQAETEEEQRQALVPTIRCEIVRDLVAHMYSYDPRPQKEFCSKVAQMLIQKYGFMADKGLKVSGYGSWEKRIIERIHNVASTKKRHMSTEDPSSTTPVAKRGRPKQQSLLITRYPILSNTNDDEISINRNCSALRKELDREKPRKELVLNLCKLTFSKRRDDILMESDSVSATSILQDHIELHKSYVLEQEIDLILGKSGVVKRAVSSWTKKWVPAILQYSYTLAGKKASTILGLQKKYEGDAVKDEKIALSVLTHFLPKKGSDTGYIYDQCKMTDDPMEFAKKDPKLTAPRFAYFDGGEGAGEYFLFVDSLVLTKVVTFSDALMLWFVIHYIFNLEYEQKVKEVPLFFQEFVFELPATAADKKKNATYLSVTTDIAKYTTCNV